jgi:ankyrin repeat protein
VNLQNNLGQTPLMLSVINENRFYYGELTNYYKADPKATDITGKQAIDYTGTNENSSLKTSLTTYMFFYKE